MDKGVGVGEKCIWREGVRSFLSALASSYRGDTSRRFFVGSLGGEMRWGCGKHLNPRGIYPS